MGVSVAAIVEVIGDYFATAVLYAAEYSAYVEFAAILLYSNYQSKMMASKARAAVSADLANRKLMFKQPITVHRYIYGRARVSGPITFMETTNIPGTGAYQKLLYILITVAAHEVHAIDDVYFGDQRVDLDPSGDGSVLGEFKDFAVIKKGLGTTAGDADLNAYLSAAFPDKWTANHKQTGRAKLLVRLTYSTDKFPGGLPNISCVIRGKPVFDPRTLTTYYSTNAALCLRDYVTGAHGAAALAKIENSGTAQAGGSSTMTLEAGASAVDDAYRYMTVRALAGTGAGQKRRITGYVGTTKVATVDVAWSTVPDATTIYEVTGIAAEIDETSFANAANVCDEYVALTAQATGFLVEQYDPILYPPPQADRTASGTGSLASGSYYYAVTFTNGATESTLGRVSEAILVGSPGDGGLHRIKLKELPIGPAGITGRNIYRSTDGDTFNLAGTVADNTTLIFTDTGSTTGVEPPTINTLAGFGNIKLASSHPHIDDYQQVTLSSTGTLPSPLAPATTYYYISHGEQSGSLATTKANAIAGTTINFTTTGLAVRNSGTAQAGSSTTITLAAGASAVDDYYKDMTVRVRKGHGGPRELRSDQRDMQSRRITAYNGTTKVATVESAWSITPNNSTEYEIVDAHYITRVSEPRYCLDGLIDTDSTPKQIAESMLTSCAGKMICPGGQWSIYPGVWVAPTITLDENDLDGSIKVTTRLSKSDLCNGIKGVYVDAGNKWEPTDFPPVTNATYLSEDGGEQIWRDLLLGYTISSSATQRIAKIELERTRQQIVVVLPCKLTALRVQIGDVIGVTNARFGWSAKAFEVVNLKFAVRQSGNEPRLGVDLTLRETASGVYDWSAGEETLVDLAPNTDLVESGNIAAIQGLTADGSTEKLYVRSDGTVLVRVQVSWTPYPNDIVTSGGSIEVQYRLSTSTAEDWEKCTPVPGADSSLFTPDLTDGATYYIRARAITRFGNVSDWATIVYIVTGSATAVASVTGLVSYFQAGFTHIKWNAVPDARAISYEVRKGPVYASAQVLGTTVQTDWQTNGDDTYWVVTLAPLVRASTPASIAITGSSLVENIVAGYDEYALGWPGTLSGGATVDPGTGYIVLGGSGLISDVPVFSDLTTVEFYGGVATSGEYTIPTAHEVDVGTAQVCTISCSYVVDGASVPGLGAGDYSAYIGATVQIALAQNDGIYAAWQYFSPGQYIARKIKFRILLTSTLTTVTPVLSQFAFQVDMPDRVDIQSITTAAGGTAFTYSPAFQVVPNVQVTILDAAQGDDVFFLAGPTASGGTVQVKNGGTGVARTVNILSQGY